VVNGSTDPNTSKKTANRSPKKKRKAETTVISIGVSQGERSAKQERGHIRMDAYLLVFGRVALGAGGVGCLEGQENGSASEEIEQTTGNIN